MDLGEAASLAQPSVHVDRTAEDNGAVVIEIAHGLDRPRLGGDSSIGQSSRDRLGDLFGPVMAAGGGDEHFRFMARSSMQSKSVLGAPFAPLGFVLGWKGAPAAPSAFQRRRVIAPASIAVGQQERQPERVSESEAGGPGTATRSDSRPALSGTGRALARYGAR